MLLYNTEWRYDHGMAVNYHGKKFYNIGPRKEAEMNEVKKGKKMKMSKRC